MATSKCGSCGGHSFEIKEVSPNGGRFKYSFVQCSSCGVPVGVLDFFNLGSLLQDQEKAIGSLADKIDRIARKLP